MPADVAAEVERPKQLPKKPHSITMMSSVIQKEQPMSSTLTSKGQVTIPKQIRDALNLVPGCPVEFSVNSDGEVVLHKANARSRRKRDRFEAARGKADVKWRTDELMALLRGED
jgi:AbrB family looped-hinge helix DNA binding protein